MDRKELEREILEACERVAGARGRYAKLCQIEDTIRGVNSLAHGLGNAKPYREAKELLADLVREQALSEDRLWRALIEGTADRILDSFQEKLNDLHNALLADERPALVAGMRPDALVSSREVEAIEILRQIEDRVTEGKVTITKEQLEEIHNLLAQD
jgi:hypothetical protein